MMRARTRSWLGLAAIPIIAVAAITVYMLERPGSRGDARAQRLVSKKGLPGGISARKNSETAIGANEERSPDSTPDVEAYLRRAYPADEVSMDQTIGAQNASRKAIKNSFY